MTSKLKAVRAGHRSAVTKLLKKIEDFGDDFSAGGDSAIQLTQIIDNLRKKEKILEEINTEILDKTSEEEVAAEMSDTDEYSYFLEFNIRKTEQLVNSNKLQRPNIPSNSGINTDQQSTSTSLNNGGNPVLTYNSTVSNANTISSQFHKLPKLTLPIFDGDILQWQSFWDSFESAVHDNEQLSNAQKFNYLKSQLQHEASQCISGLQITNTNYIQAVYLLKQRFGQPHKIINAYMQSLINIPSPSPNIASLKHFYDTIENYVRGLESLGVGQNSYGAMFVPIFLNKLPANIRQNITREHGNDDWDLMSLRMAIQKEICIQDAGQVLDNVDIGATSTAVFLTATETGNRNVRCKELIRSSDRRITFKPCVFCLEVHDPAFCKTINDTKTRKDIVRSKCLCFNCLGKHKIKQCKSNKSCRKCNKRHHTSICDKQQNYLQKHNAENGNTTIVHSVTSSVPSTVLLKTAVAQVTSDTHQITTAKILFDEGAQRSFITEEIADTLNIKPSGKENITISGFGENNDRVRSLKSGKIYLQGVDGIQTPIDVLIVPKISLPIQTRMQDVTNYPYLKGLKLANSIYKDRTFQVNMLIGADHYWDIVEDKIIRGNGPTAMKSKVGYLLSGRTC